MNNIISIFKKNRSEILGKWLGSIFPEYLEQISKSEFGVVNKPLLYQVNQEFNEILGYMLSDDPKLFSMSAPVAKTLIKFRALNVKDASQAVSYAIELKNILLSFFPYRQNGSAEILLAIDLRIQQVLLAAFDFYSKTREDIYNIKLKELERGVFVGETTGCPSGMMDHDTQNTRNVTDMASAVVTEYTS